MSNAAEMELRVALALIAVTAHRPGNVLDMELPILTMDPDFHDLPEDHKQGTDDDVITQEAVLKLARAAIAAMREPTPSMTRACFRANRHVNPATCDEPTCVGAVTMVADAAWRAMIGAALGPAIEEIGESAGGAAP